MPLTAIQVVVTASVAAVVVMGGVLHWLLGQLVVGYAQMEAAARLDELAPSPGVVEKSSSATLGLAAPINPASARR